MAKTYLRAAHYECGPMGPGSWRSSTYSLFDNGLVIAVTEFVQRPDEKELSWKYGEPIGSVVYSAMHIDPETIDRMKVMIYDLKKKYKSRMFDYFDGNSWEITAYNSDGRIIRNLPMNIIYEYPDLMALVELIPKEPAYEMYIQRRRRELQYQYPCIIT